MARDGIREELVVIKGSGKMKDAKTKKKHVHKTHMFTTHWFHYILAFLGFFLALEIAQVQLGLTVAIRRVQDDQTPARTNPQISIIIKPFTSHGLTKQTLCKLVGGIETQWRITAKRSYEKLSATRENLMDRFHYTVDYANRTYRYLQDIHLQVVRQLKREELAQRKKSGRKET
ncbi:MAG: hypothetical protein L6R35_006342, partial [Caloplaca aegaea]